MLGLNWESDIDVRYTVYHYENNADKCLNKRIIWLFSVNQISNQIPDIVRELAYTPGLNRKKIYVPELLPNVKPIDIFPKEVVPPRGVQSSIFKQLLTTNHLAEASLILVPHEWQDIRHNWDYIDMLQRNSARIPILIFNTGDKSPPVNIKNAIQIRTFLHPGESSMRKIIIPYPVLRREFKLREWNAIPKVGFMGHVPKLSPGSLVSRPRPSFRYPIKSSSYLSRRLSITKLQNLVPEIDVDLVVRSSFTALHKNKNLLAHSNDFQEQLFNCDYILCPRGYGNTSMRFYEALSAGKTPILVDSAGEMPRLNKGQDWRNHILSVDLRGKWAELILQDWGTLSKGKNYFTRQLSNLDLFNSVLDFDSYMAQLFSEYAKSGDT